LGSFFDELDIIGCLGGSRFLSFFLRGIFNGLLGLGLLGILLFLLCSLVHVLEGDVQLEITLELLLRYFIGSEQVFIVGDVNKVVLSIAILDRVVHLLWCSCVAVDYTSQCFDCLGKIADSLDLRVEVYLKIY
jgi:hypothetical protein